MTLFLQSFSMALRAISAKKMRSFLTMLGCIIGVGVVVALYSVAEAENQKKLEQLKSLSDNTITVYAYEYLPWGMVTPGTSIADKLSKYINTDLSSLTAGVAPQSYIGGQIVYGSKKTNPSYGYATNEQFSICSSNKIVKGRDLVYLDVKNSNKVCVIGSAMNDFLFGYKEPIGEKISINGMEFTVVGVYAQKDFSPKNPQGYSPDNLIVAPYTAIQKYVNKTLRIESFLVKAQDPFAVKEAIKMIKSFLKKNIDVENNKGYFDVYSQDDWTKEIEKQNKEDLIFQIIIAVISLVVGGIGIMNIMLVTVTERTREIGIRKAIGAPRRSIILQFLIEASVLSIIGGIIGLIVGVMGTLVYGKLKADLIAMPNPTIMIIGLAFSFIMGVVFGIYPAIKAARLQPVIALRNE